MAEEKEPPIGPFTSSYLQEDIHDLVIVAERRAESTITSKKLKEKLKKDELL
jgi:hypothetical protein